MPAPELALFRQNISYARDMVSTAVVLNAQLTAAINTDDLLRSALVQGVSAFDHFVHEEVRARMLLIQQGVEPATSAYYRFKVRLGSVDQALGHGGIAWLDAEIREQHGYVSFQQPDKVADAFRLVSECELWSAVAQHLCRSPGDIKRELKLIVDRRNKIAHEADTDPTPPRARYRIDEPLVRDSLDFLEKLVEGLLTVT